MAAQDWSFDRARAVLFDPQYMNRQTSLGALQTLGFKNVEPVGRIDDLPFVMGQVPADLLIAEVSGHEARICDFVRSLRHRHHGLNPFLLIILTTWSLTQETVRNVLNSGADDLLARPFTIAQVRQRVMAGAMVRKPFVVTCDYIGPSRRKSQRTPAQDGLFAVPNSLQGQMRPKGGEISLETIDAAWESARLWKAYRLAERIEQLAKPLDPVSLDPDGAMVSARVIEAIGRTAETLEAALAGLPVPDREEIAAFCIALKMAPGRMSAKTGDATETLRLIKDIAGHIARKMSALKPASMAAEGEAERALETVAV